MNNKVKVYSKKDIELLKSRKGTKQERMYAKMLQPDDIQLSENEEMEYRLLTRAWTLISQFDSQLTAVKRLMQMEGMTRYQAMILIKDAQDLLGPILQTNQEYERALVKEKCLKIYARAIELDDPKSAAMAMSAYIKAAGIDKTGESKTIHIPEVPEVTFSNEIPEIEDAEIIESEE